MATLVTWEFKDPFTPGTLVRADAMNVQFEGIETTLSSMQNFMTGNLLRMPDGFKGNSAVPNKTLVNRFIFINADGDVDLYPLTGITQFVDAAASSATSSAQSATVSGEKATIAGQRAGLAEQYKNDAYNSKQAAAQSVSQAAEKADLAGLRANAPENTVVPGGGYSAFHWSEKVRKTAEIFDVDLVQARLDEIELIALAGL